MKMPAPVIVMDWPNNTQLNQITSRVEYVMLDNNYKTLHKPFFCKDYFNEILATEVDGKSRKQYGFVSEKFPFDILKEDTFKLALLFKEGINREQYVNGLLYLLPQADANRGFEPVSIELPEDTGQIILNISTDWLQQPALWGFYTLLIRVAYNYQSEEFEDYITNIYSKYDSSQTVKSGEYMTYSQTIPFITYLFQGGQFVQSWEEQCKLDNMSILHNSSGMINYFNSYNKDLNKIKEDVKNSQKVESL